MKLVIFGVCAGLALWVSGAFGADVNVTWTNPTKNTDGTTIPATGNGSLTGSRIEWGTCVSGAFGTKAGELSVGAGVTSAPVTNLEPATVCFRVFARNTYLKESAASNVATKVILPPVPEPPVITTVATLAYDLTSLGNIGRLVGKVPLNTPCVGNAIRTWKDGSTFYQVPIEAVTLTREPRSTIVVAKCTQTG
jgi:hypothetical protein